jgi:hypothetical protein
MGFDDRSGKLESGAVTFDDLCIGIDEQHDSGIRPHSHPYWELKVYEFDGERGGCYDRLELSVLFFQLFPPTLWSSPVPGSRSYQR